MCMQTAKMGDNLISEALTGLDSCKNRSRRRKYERMVSEFEDCRQRVRKVSQDEDDVDDDVLVCKTAAAGAAAGDWFCCISKSYVDYVSF
jgi:hypothetical protein